MLARAQGLHLGRAGRDRGRAVLGDAKIGQALLRAEAEECVLKRQEDTRDSAGDAGIMEKRWGGWGSGPRQES